MIFLAAISIGFPTPPIEPQAPPHMAVWWYRTLVHMGPAWGYTALAQSA